MSGKPAHIGENFRARIRSTCPCSFWISRFSSIRQFMMERESRNPASLSNCSCVSIAPMRVPSKSRFDITGVAAIFLFPRRTKHTPAGETAAVCGILLHVPMGVPPAQSASIRAETLRLAMGLKLYFFAAAQADLLRKSGERRLRVRRNRYNAVPLAEGLHCIDGQPQYPCDLRAAFSCLSIADNVIPFSVCHESVPFRSV